MVENVRIFPTEPFESTQSRTNQSPQSDDRFITIHQVKKPYANGKTYKQNSIDILRLTRLSFLLCILASALLLTPTLGENTNANTLQLDAHNPSTLSSNAPSLHASQPTTIETAPDTDTATASESTSTLTDVTPSPTTTVPSHPSNPAVPRVPSSTDLLESASFIESFTHSFLALFTMNRLSSHTNSSSSSYFDTATDFVSNHWLGLTIGGILFSGALWLTLSKPWLSNQSPRRRKKPPTDPRNQPLLVELKSKSGRMQSLDWVEKTMKKDEHGDEAHEFLGPF